MSQAESTFKLPFIACFILLWGPLLNGGTCKGESSLLDSLGYLLESDIGPRQRIDLLNKIGNEIRNSDPNLARPYIVEALSETADYPRGRVESWSQMSLIFMNKPDFDSAEYSLEQALSFARHVSSEDTVLFRVYSAAASLYLRSSQYPKARKYANKGLDLAMRKGSRRGTANFYLYLGVVEFQLGKWNEALVWYESALSICEEDQWVSGMYACYANIGNIYDRQGLTRDALELYQKSLELQEKKGFAVNIPPTHLNIAHAYLKLHNTSKARYHSLMSLKLAEESGQTRVAAKALNNMSEVYLDLDSLPEALDYAERSMKMHQSIDDSIGMAEACLSVAQSHFGMGNYRRALVYGEKAYRWSVGNGKIDLKMYASKLLSQTHEELGEYRMALSRLYEFNQLEDSLINVASIRKSSDQVAQIAYERKKEMEDMERKQRDEMEAEELKRSLLIRNILFWGCIILFLIVLAGATAYFRIRHINHKLALQAKEITYLNDNLEQLVQSRSAELNLRNRQLSEYIFTNSHRLRGPIARILGLLQLKEAGEFKSREETDEVIQFIYQSAKEADKVIFEIGDRLEE